MSARESYITKTARIITPNGVSFANRTAHAESIAAKGRPKHIADLLSDMRGNASSKASGAQISDSPTVQKAKGIGEHFKKHWPGYAAAGAAGVIGTSYLKKKNDKQTSVPAQAV